MKKILLGLFVLGSTSYANTDYNAKVETVLLEGFGVEITGQGAKDVFEKMGNETKVISGIDTGLVRRFKPDAKSQCTHMLTSSPYFAEWTCWFYNH